MARILFTWELGGASGHWAKIRPVAEALARTGHDVFAALRKVDVICEKWQPRLPLKIFQAPYLSAAKAVRIYDTRSLVHILHNVGFCSDERLSVTISAWKNLFSSVRPDIIVFDHSPTAMLAARDLECGRVVMGTGFSLPPDLCPLPDLQPWQEPIEDVLERDEEKMLERINRVLGERGGEQLSQISQLYQDVDENLLLTFPELDHYGPRTGEVYWGIWSSGGDQVPEWLPEKNRLKIFAYLKMFQTLPNLLQLLAQLDYDVIAYLPDCNQKQLDSFRSQSMRFLSGAADLTELMHECDLALINGNVSTGSHFLRSGIPCLSVPLNVEQWLGAFRMNQSSLGASLSAKHPNTFAAELKGILAETRYKEAASAFARRYESYDADSMIDSIVERITQMI